MKLKVRKLEARSYLWVVFALGLVYIILPGPSRIEDFKPLPSSVKSELEGDTIQNPNIAAYFSQYDREYITSYYRKMYQGLLLGIPAIRINHPPENARVFVRDQQESTFLEEYVHPLRDSIYVNGYEPEIENSIFHRKSGFVGNHINYQDTYYVSKTTLRFYPSSLVLRTAIYLLIWAAGWYLWRLWVKAVKE